jgi:hypothetical protein
VFLQSGFELQDSTFACTHVFPLFRFAGAMLKYFFAPKQAEKKFA